MEEGLPENIQRWTAKRRAFLVLSILRGETSVQQGARQHGLTVGEIEDWQERGTHELHDVVGRIDIITTTLGKALGGASGGCVSGRRELVEMCRQRARPYLFSNTVVPVIMSGALQVLAQYGI